LPYWLHDRLGSWRDSLLRHAGCRILRLSSGSGVGLDRLLPDRRRGVILDRFGSQRLGSRGGDRCVSLLGRIKRGRFRLPDWRSVLLLSRSGGYTRRLLDRPLSTVQQPLHVRRLARQEDAHQKDNDGGNEHIKEAQTRPTRSHQASVSATVVVATVHSQVCPSFPASVAVIWGKLLAGGGSVGIPHVAYSCGYSSVTSGWRELVTITFRLGEASSNSVTIGAASSTCSKLSRTSSASAF
jgi:hypothetical protein